MLPEQYGDYHHCEQRERNQHCRLPVRGGVGEEAEGGACVFGMSQLEEAGDDLDVLVHRDVSGDEAFSQAVEEEDGEGDEEVGGACGGVGHSGIGLDIILTSELCRAVIQHLFPVGTAETRRGRSLRYPPQGRLFAPPEKRLRSG